MGQSVMNQTKGVILAKGLIVSYAVTGILLFLLGVIMFKAQPANIVINAGIVFAYIFSAFLGGMVVGKSIQEKRFIWGIVLGVLYFAIIFAVSMLMKKDIISQLGSTITVFIMCGFGGMLGGMLS